MRPLLRAVGLVVRLVVALLVILIAGGAILVAITTWRGLPDTSGTLRVPPLGGTATVLRDAAGIIQIRAADAHDLFVAQGYVHAQERMWQMEISRRIGAGRLSELFGRSQVDTDRYIRTLGWRQAAARDLEAMSPEVVGYLQAYADGVNAWIDEHRGKLSTPFVVAGVLSGRGGVGGYDLEPWTPLDTATWQKVQAWSLGGNMDSEVFRLLADARFGGDTAKTDLLFPPYAPDAPIITPTELIGVHAAAAPPSASTSGGTPASAAAVSSADAVALAAIARRGAQIADLAGFAGGDTLIGGRGVGSNNWVVSGAHTASGKPLLANDPHLGLGMPSVWIMNGLHCTTVSATCPWDVVGVSFPGAPAVILGHNARIAWGATNVGPDTQDLFLETVDPKDPTRYLADGKSVPFEIRHETIKVAGGADVAFDVRSTRHGPVMSDVDDKLKGAGKPVLALRWTTIAEPDQALESFFRIDVAASFDDFRAAFADYGSPSQNFVYADVDGHIGYVLPGLIPVRAGEKSGDRVRDGASGTQEWTGYVPRDALPWQLDPPSGRIVSANNAAVDGSYPHWLGDEWDPGYRAARITKLLDGKPKGLTGDDMRAIQGDTYVLRADRLVPAVSAVGATPATDDGRAVQERIDDWDHFCDIGSAGCAAYMTFEVALERALFDDELGPVARDYVGQPPSWEALLAVLRDPANPFWDDISTPSREVPVQVVVSAFDAAGRQLRAALGDPANWTWDRLHTITFREGTLGQSGIWPLEQYFNAPARPVSGANGAIVNNYYRVDRGYADPYDPDYRPVGIDRLFAVSNGPSYRLTIDMASLDAARIIITTGQSGNPFDAHYADLIPLWATGQTVPLPFSRSDIDRSAVSTLTLDP